MSALGSPRMNCAPLSYFSVSINWSSSISWTRELWKIRLQRTKWKEKTEKSSKALRPKKNQNSETQKSPEKEFKTHHKHFKSEISRLRKIFRDPRFSRYHSISSIPLCFNCRFPLQTPCTKLAGFLLFLSVPGLWQTWPCNSLLTFLSKSISSLLFRRLPGLLKPNCPNFR